MFTFVANPPNLANRGVHSYVNVAGSRLAGTVPDLPFATVAGVSGECLPIYVLEGIYGRMVVACAPAWRHYHSHVKDVVSQRRSRPGRSA